MTTAVPAGWRKTFLGLSLALNFSHNADDGQFNDNVTLAGSLFQGRQTALTNYEQQGFSHALCRYRPTELFATKPSQPLPGRSFT
ncbi:hypothetical protein P4S64_05265 [Vibrio sp. M60_M31a]